MRAGQKQQAPGKAPAVEAPTKTKDAPVVGKIIPKAEPEDELDDADDPTEDMTDDAADGADGDEDPMLASPIFNDKKKNKKSPAK